ncbi:hypothetical protein H4I96_04168 [Botrytis cinerea]
MTLYDPVLIFENQSLSRFYNFDEAVSKRQRRDINMSADSITSTRSGTPPILKCPFEIRLMIYRILIPSIDPSADFDWTSAWDPNRPKSRCEEHKLYSPPILHTNQMIYREVLNELYCFLPYRTSISNYGIRFLGYTFIKPPPAFQYLAVFSIEQGNSGELRKMLEKNLYPLRRNLRRLNQFVVRRVSDRDISSSNRSVSGSFLAQREEFMDTVQGFMNQLAREVMDRCNPAKTIECSRKSILLSCTNALIFPNVNPRGYNSTGSNSTKSNNSTKSEQSLRIQPLGNSITFGYLSSDGNGFRLGLRNLLTSAGNTVQYVGSVRAGNMSDNFNEGHPGAIISEIAEYAKLSLPEDPNLVLLMAGTNDMNNFNNVTTAPDRLSGLIDEITSMVPNVTVIVAQLTPASNSSVDAAMVAFNSKIPISLLNMMDYVTVNDLVDGLHPTDYGYQQMAKAWFAGIQQVQKNGWIDPPISTNVTLALQTAVAASTATSTISSSSASSTSTQTTSTTIGSSSSTASSKSASDRNFRSTSISTRVQLAEVLAQVIKRGHAQVYNRKLDNE